MLKASRFLLAAAALAVPHLARAEEARPAVRIEVSSRITAFEGRTFGDYGPYERIAGVAHLRIDPNAPANRDIVDVALAPRAADGMVDYDVDVVILRPQNGAKARRVLLYDVVNRGMKLVSMFTGGSAMGPADPIDPGDGLLLRQGYTLVWSGWQGDIALAGNGRGLMGARFPTATGDGKIGGKPLTGPVSTEAIFDNATSNRITLPFRANTLDQGAAKLTVRAVSGSPERAIAASDWHFDDDRHVTLTRPAGMDAGAIYRFAYVARDPVVMGLGFSATRDLIAFLRHGTAAQGNPLADIAQAPCEKDAKDACTNPNGGVYSATIAFGASQSGRYLRDYVWQGFNRDLAGRTVFDGVIPFIPGARQTFTNFRFAEPGRFSRQHEDHDVPGFGFPFTYATLTDPVTGKSDGILKSCTASGTCPKLFHVDTSGEFWQAGASLVGTGGTARDVALPAGVRAYMIAGGAHAPGMTMPACRYPANPLNYAPVVRALLFDMVEWTAGRRAPPDSRWPSLARGELKTIAALNPPAGDIAWPKVFNQPIPPAGKPAWPQFVPAVDGNGNDAAGIRLPDVAAARGTYLGWNLRKPGYGEGDLCLIFGSYVPFADGDARRDVPALGAARAAAAAALVADNLLLSEDADRTAAATK
ncbi:MAG TPA: alpha/beta hydrolase domain-containing protein [Novosphingobium sp.]